MKKETGSVNDSLVPEESIFEGPTPRGSQADSKG